MAVFPPLDFSPKVTYSNGKAYVFDVLRKKYLVFSPEEEVRQKLLYLLTDRLYYPKALIRTEGGLKYHTLAKRSDLLVYDSLGNPFLLAECKAPKVRVDERVVRQAAVYNKVIGAPYLLVTNGAELFCWHIDQEKGETVLQNELPAFPRPTSDYTNTASSSS